MIEINVQAEFREYVLPLTPPHSSTNLNVVSPQTSSISSSQLSKFVLILVTCWTFQRLVVRFSVEWYKLMVENKVSFSIAMNNHISYCKIIPMKKKIKKFFIKTLLFNWEVENAIKRENKNFTLSSLDSLSVLNKSVGLNHLLLTAFLLIIKKPYEKYW